MGSKSERLVHQFLELLVNPKMAVPRTNLILMTKEKQFVTASQCAKVTLTPEQQENQKELNNLICRYVEFRLRYSAYFQKPVSKKHFAIYMQSLNPAML